MSIFDSCIAAILYLSNCHIMCFGKTCIIIRLFQTPALMLPFIDLTLQKACKPEKTKTQLHEGSYHTFKASEFKLKPVLQLCPVGCIKESQYMDIQSFFIV